MWFWGYNKKQGRVSKGGGSMNEEGEWQQVRGGEFIKKGNGIEWEINVNKRGVGVTLVKGV